MSNPTRNRRGIRSTSSINVGLVSLLLSASAPDSQAGPSPPVLGKMLAIERYALTFEESFDRLDVSPRGPGTRWIAHTPWNGDFGDASFADPGPDGPFRITNGLLKIEMRFRRGRWQSGLLSGGDQLSRGSRPLRSYFEIRAKLPGGPGVWPAFWLASIGVNGTPNPEIDVLEYYGQFPDAYRATTHVWRDGKSIAGETYRIDVPKHALENAFHTYGVSIDEDYVIFYLDRRAVAFERTRSEYLQPMFPMVNLAAGGGWPITGMKNPSILQVDYIRSFRRKP